MVFLLLTNLSVEKLYRWQKNNLNVKLMLLLSTTVPSNVNKLRDKKLELFLESYRYNSQQVQECSGVLHREKKKN